MASTRRRSVRRQLLTVLLTVVSAAWIIAAGLSFLDARHEVSDGDGDEIEAEHAPVLHRYSRRAMFQVWEDGRVLRLHSQNAPNTPLSRVREGFSETTIGDTRWRVFSAWDARDRVLVQVPEQSYERDELTTAVARNFVLPLAIALPILGGAIWVAVGRALRSVTDVNQQVASRTADNLTPIDVTDAPLGIGALVSSLNSLFDRVEQMIEQERQFTGEAAHELRTPLAAIRAQAQVAQGATDDVERIRALSGVIAGCDRATHTVEQMLTLARLAPDAVSFDPVPVDLGIVLRGASANRRPSPWRKRSTWGSRTDPASPFPATPGCSPSSSGTWLHAFAMETKEHLPWIASMLTTAVAFIAVRYRPTALSNPAMRRMAFTLLAASFAIVAWVSLLGVFVNKVAPLD